MNSVLIICGMFGSSESANGICAKNIAEEMLNRGISINIITDGEIDSELVEKGINIYSIKESWFKGFLRDNMKNQNPVRRILFHIIHLFRNVVSSIVYPNVSPFREKNVTKSAIQIIRENDIDMVLGLYRPYESISSVLKLKQLFGERIIGVTYHLDLLSAPENQSKMIRAYKAYKGKRAFLKELRDCDRILLPNSAKELGIKHEKLNYLDFPLYKKEYGECHQTIDFEFDKAFINISYVGTLDSENRSPKEVVGLLEKLHMIHGKKIILHIWGKLNDIETERMIKGNHLICYHGLINNNFVMTVLRNSDFLLNISNRITYRMIPSKIFQLFAANKPIINIVQHKDDAALPYFYKSSCSLSIMIDNSDNIKQLSAFIEKSYNATVYNKRDIFIESTPEYAVDVILGGGDY